MTIDDYRQLLKAAIRGTLYEYDAAVSPALIDADGEAIPPDREARAAGRSHASRRGAASRQLSGAQRPWR